MQRAVAPEPRTADVVPMPPGPTPASVSLARGAVRRPGPGLAEGDATSDFEQLRRTLRTIKTARFNAADRLELKRMLSLFTMAMLALYVGGLTVWLAVHAAEIDTATGRVVMLATIMSSVLSLCLALLDWSGGYQLQAYHLKRSGQAIADLLEELELSRPAGSAALVAYRRRFGDLLRGCGCNHQQVDYLLARADETGCGRDKAWAHARYLADVYALHGAFLLAPPLTLLMV